MYVQSWPVLLLPICQFRRIMTCNLYSNNVSVYRFLHVGLCDRLKNKENKKCMNKKKGNKLAYKGACPVFFAMTEVVTASTVTLKPSWTVRSNGGCNGTNSVMVCIHLKWFKPMCMYIQLTVHQCEQLYIGTFKQDLKNHGFGIKVFL